MLLEGNPYKRALLKQDPAPGLTCSFLHKEMWKDVAMFLSIFFTWWLMLNIIYAQSLQESKDDISCQPCMTAYLSFVTIFNTIYQRKTGFQKPKNSQMLCICKMPMFKTERLAAMTERCPCSATANNMSIFNMPHLLSAFRALQQAIPTALPSFSHPIWPLTPSILLILQTPGEISFPPRSVP